ncbi:MAG: hypothetical protein COV46_02865 [Deltaproteobacteria bacterium CG11_big_fil_rev_8_21_14_0_20_49_13]|nr:MAG: hypothetical protein COV46_02865 [Deltaproteobacteria bacterium CG11_big_fil_rev_8_21_14_0_20_49_13]
MGNLFLSVALAVSFYSLVASAFGGRNPLMAEKGRRSAHLVTVLVSLASLMIIYLFVSNAFEVKYIAEYSSRDLPFVYKLTGIWAGLDGSLLFWAWLLAICTSLAVRKISTHSYVNAVLQFIISFFLVMLVFEANPFDLLTQPLPDGQGLNPLLQNFFMIIHPPALYIGYVGMAVPFAYVIARLILKEGLPSHNDETYKKVRLWTVYSWLFLTAGNLLGAMWAYVELGWGGFWAWDPVENAGILPWFTATAFLHSLIVQEKRGLLVRWNILLVIATFLLTIFGTFITRSGVIQSVHSFSDITIGAYFLVFMAVAVIVSAYLMISRVRTLRPERSLESLASHEGGIYLNNVVLVFALIGIMWGTMLPLFAGWFYGQKMEVGPAFFNRVLAPVGIVILFLTGIGPELSWRRWRKGLFKREYLWPALMAVITGAAAYFLGIRMWFPLLTAAGSAFAIFTIVLEFVSAGRLKSSPLALLRLAPKRYGGYLVHFGVVLLFIGIAGSSYKGEYQFGLREGTDVDVAGYKLLLTKFDWERTASSEGVKANVLLGRKGKTLKLLKPALYIYRNQPKPTAEVDIYIRPLKDVYLSLSGLDKDEKGAEFVLTINPLISFVWLGGLIMIIGTIFAILPPKKRESLTANDEEDYIDIVLGRADKEDFI